MKRRKEKSLKEIKAEILKCLERIGVKSEKIILFGSRARGDYSKGSDYDFLIITEKTFAREEKIKISREIRRTLVKWYIPSDLIIKSAEEVSYSKDKIGSVAREALKEGLSI